MLGFFSRSRGVALAAMALVACDVGEGDSSDPFRIPSGAGGEGAGVSNGGNGQGGASTTTTGGVGGGVQGSCDGPGPAIEVAGSTTRFLLKGTLLLPTGPTNGELLIDNNTITCIGSCAGDPGASGATVIDTRGVISPGLIDGHNHILFDIFNEDDWVPPQVYTNHNQWPNDAKYGAVVDAKQYFNGEFGSPLALGCELLKYGETKALISGTTSVQGSPGTGKNCFGSVARSIDVGANDLPADKMQTATIFPSNSAANGVCTNFGDGDTTAYVIHIGEGVDTSARNEFDTLATISTTQMCLYDPKTTLVHATALDDARLQTMAANGMSIVWSPKSNVFLYGAGTDMTKTTNIPQALSLGIRVSIAPDWSLGGSQNMLDEMRYADQVDNAVFGNILDAKKIWEMSTSDAAIVLGVSQYIGSLEVGKRADIAVYCPGTADPYESVLVARPTDVTMVMVDGRLLYGDQGLESVGPANSECELIDICGASKFLCVAETGGNPADRLDQKYSEYSQILEQAMSDYDALDLTQWDFAPIAPLVTCP